MALEFVAEIIGTPLMEAIRRRRPGPRTLAAIRWLQEMAEPPSGLELRSSDGSAYSGVALLERSEVVLLLAVRHPPGRQPERPPVVTPPPRQHDRPLYHQHLDPDSPHWDRDGDPFLR